MNRLEQFKNTISQVNDATVAASAKASLTNKAAWEAFFILRDGKLADKLELKKLVSKEGTLHKARGIVSKAKFVVDAVNEGMELNVTIGRGDNAITIDVSQEAFKAYSFDAVPDAPLTSIYQAVKATDKAQSMDKEVAELATLALEEQHNKPIAEIKQELGELFDAVFDNAKHEARKSVEESSVSNIEAIKESISKLSANDIATLADYVLSLVATNESKAA